MQMMVVAVPLDVLVVVDHSGTNVARLTEVETKLEAAFANGWELFAVVACDGYLVHYLRQ